MEYTIGATNMSSISIGDRFRVINNNGLNGVKIGDIVIANSNSKTGTFVAVTLKDKTPNKVQLGKHVEKIGCSVEELEKRMIQYQKRIDDINNKIKYMKDRRLDELDEQKYTRYLLLKEIDKGSPLEEKEEAIDEIIKLSKEDNFEYDIG